MEIFCRTSCPELTSPSLYMACFRGPACGVFPLHCVRSVSFALRARKMEKNFERHYLLLRKLQKMDKSSLFPCYCVCLFFLARFLFPCHCVAEK